MNERFFKQAIETLESNDCGGCPTLATRPERFKTAILVAVDDKRKY